MVIMSHCTLREPQLYHGVFQYAHIDTHGQEQHVSQRWQNISVTMWLAVTWARWRHLDFTSWHPFPTDLDRMSSVSPTDTSGPRKPDSHWSSWFSSYSNDTVDPSVTQRPTASGQVVCSYPCKQVLQSQHIAGVSPTELKRKTSRLDGPSATDEESHLRRGQQAGGCTLTETSIHQKAIKLRNKLEWQNPDRMTVKNNTYARQTATLSGRYTLEKRLSQISLHEASFVFYILFHLINLKDGNLSCCN